MSDLLYKCEPYEWRYIQNSTKTNAEHEVIKQLSIYSKERLSLEERAFDYLMTLYVPVEEEPCIELDNILSINNICKRKFILELKSVLNREIQKINTFRIYGRSNTCKTLILDLICSELVCYKSTQGNAQNDFFFAPMLHRSVIMLDEFFVNRLVVEDMKKVLGGGEIDVNCKNIKERQRLKRTPFLVTCQKQAWGRGQIANVDENALSNRCFNYRFDRVYKPKCNITSSHVIAWLYKEIKNVN